MYLEKIEIHGFKSFAQKTVLTFPKPHTQQNGITAVVGPNGSGKSNIVDAIRWVLGEQGQKHLRTGSSKDVIFSGSKKKGQLSMAEVTLFFNNSDKRAPVDYEEIVITRRVYRDGDSEYLLNGNKVRLADIALLLAQCHVGQKSYSIIGQGMVTQIITASPAERKEFFDEATGIKTYQLKRDHSMRKLKKTQENITQTEQILGEITPHKTYLEKQVKKLQQRTEIEQRLAASQVSYYAHILHGLEQEEEKLKERHAELADKKKTLEQEIAELRAQGEKLFAEPGQESTFNTLQNELNNLLVEKSRIQKELANIEATKHASYKAAGKQNLSWLENKETELSHRKSTFTQEFKVIEGERSSINTSIDELQKLISSKEGELKTLELSSQPEDTSKIPYHIAEILRQKDRFDGVIGLVSELAHAPFHLKNALETAAGRHMGSIVVQNDHVAKECIAYLKKHRLGTATFLPLNKIKKRHIYLRDSDTMNIDGVLGLGIDLLSFEAQYEDLFSFVLGNTVVVENLSTAQRVGIGKERMVTLQGDISETTGAMRGGYNKYKSAFKFGVAQNISEQYDNIEAAINEVTQAIEQHKAELNNLFIQQEVKKQRQDMLQKSINDISKEIDALRYEIQGEQMQDSDPEGRQKEIQKRIESLNLELSVVENKVEEKRAALQAVNKDTDTKQAALRDIQEKLQASQVNWNALMSKEQEITIGQTRIDTKREDLQEEMLLELGENYPALLHNFTEITIDFDTHKEFNRINRLKNQLHQIGGIDPSVVEEFETINERHTFLSTQLADLDHAYADTKKIIAELDTVIKTTFEHAFTQINKQFSAYFKKLFNGGSAQLVLTQEAAPEDLDDDELVTRKNTITAGIEIIASPPNKKIKHMNMLSGGEKTMTSIALISAIIGNHTSPFVIFDEVDAALDEANSERLANILSELSEQTQFIVITHNRVVMHVADLLYGVTMGDDGVTKMLSVSLSEAQKMAE